MGKKIISGDLEITGKTIVAVPTENNEATNKNYVDTAISQAQLGGTANFDQTPTDGSQNAVTSDGIFDALQSKENLSNKVTTINENSTDAQYPSAKVVYTNLQAKENSSNKATEITGTGDNTNYPTTKAVYDFVRSGSTSPIYSVSEQIKSSYSEAELEKFVRGYVELPTSFEQTISGGSGSVSVSRVQTSASLSIVISDSSLTESTAIYELPEVSASATSITINSAVIGSVVKANGSFTFNVDLNFTAPGVQGDTINVTLSNFKVLGETISGGTVDFFFKRNEANITSETIENDEEYTCEQISQGVWGYTKTISLNSNQFATDIVASSSNSQHTVTTSVSLDEHTITITVTTTNSLMGLTGTLTYSYIYVENQSDSIAYTPYYIDNPTVRVPVGLTAKIIKLR